MSDVKSAYEFQTGAIAEVISASITSVVAESWQGEGTDGLPRFALPGFGSFLRAESADDGVSIMSVVYDVVTGPLDSNHRPTALGMSREQLKLEQPHIFALLRTEIHAVTVGYRLNGRIYQHLPPRPPEVHDFVYPLTDAEIQSLTESLDFLGLVPAASAVASDELLAAVVREAYRARNNDYQFLVSAGKALTHLFRDDYDRLVGVLRKIKPTS